MSTLAEINQRLMEQNNEQERTSVAIEDVRKALIAQMTEERRGRLDEQEDRKEAKKVAQKPQGFMSGLSEGTGAAGLGRFAQSLLGALFGGLSGGAIAGLAGTVAGKLLKGTVLVGLITAFGEDAIKSLFGKLKEKGIDLGFSKDQEDIIAKRTTDGLFGFVVSGLLFKNPLVRIAAGIATAFKDKVFKVIEYVLGIKITDMGGKDGYAVAMPDFLGGQNLKLDESWITGLTTAVTAFTAWLGLKLLKLGKNLIFKGEDKVGKAVDKALKAQQAKLDNFEKKLDAERTARVNAENAARLAADDTAMQQRLANAQNATRLAADDTAMQQRLAARGAFSTAPEVMTDVNRLRPGSKVQYTKVDGSQVDATVVKPLTPKLTQLQFDRGGPIAVESSRIAPKPVDVTNTAANVNKGPQVKRGNNFNKVARGVNLLSIEGQLQELAQYGASKTTGAKSRLLGGAAKALNSTAGLAFSFVLGGLFEGEAGDGTLSGILDAQGYALMEAMANGASHSEIKALQKDLQNKVLNFGQVANDTHKALAMLSPSELLNLSNMVYAQSTGKIKGSIGKSSDFTSPLSSGRFGMGRAGYGEELSALDAIAAQNRSMGISPVVIQDNSVKSSGGNTTVTNQIDLPVQSHDASWYQRRSNTGLGF